jgi:hypothetical protein
MFSELGFGDLKPVCLMNIKHDICVWSLQDYSHVGFAWETQDSVYCPHGCGAQKTHRRMETVGVKSGRNQAQAAKVSSGVPQDAMNSSSSEW